MDIKQLQTKTILVVEDDRVIRKNLTSMLSVFFKKVYSAINGLDGIDKYQEYLPDIILTDLKMPHMDGYEMIINIKEKYSQVFTIIVSAHTDTELMIQAIHNSVDRYIVKPITEETLFESLNVYLEKTNSFQNSLITLNNNTTIDLDNHQIITNNHVSIHLNKKETLLLKLLSKNKNKNYTYQEIENHVWGNSIMSLSALRSVVRDLRKKVGPDYIKNVSSLGYRLT